MWNANQAVIGKRVNRNVLRRRMRSLEQLENRHLMTVDLAPIAIEMPEVASTEQTILVRTQVENRGTDASGEYSVQFLLSVDETFDGSDRVIMSLDRASIQGGSADRWEQPISFPDDLPQGNYFLGASIDSRNTIGESNETNNQRLSSESIRLLKGLTRISECATFGSAGTPYQTGVNCRTMNVDGYDRTYLVYVPDGVAESQVDVPMVTMFHGSTGHGNRHFNISGWKEKSDEVGLVSVFPTSLMYCQIDKACENGKLSGWTTRWNNRGFVDHPDFNFDVIPPDYPSEAAWPPDDNSFVAAIWDDVEALLPIDTDRIFATGFSNGGGRTRQLAFDMTDRLAAAAYVGTFGANVDPETPTENPIPLHAVLGTSDEKLIGLVGIAPGGELPIEPNEILENPFISEYIAQTLDVTMLSYDPMNLRPDSLQRSDVSTRMTWNQPTGENDANNVFHLSVWKDVVHTYPSAPSADKNPQGFVAADEFWEFFQQHTKSQPAFPDLVAVESDVADIGSLDEPLNLQIRVENRGEADSGEYSLQLRISLDQTISAADRVLMTLSRPSIPAHGVDDWEQLIRLPDTVPQGEYFIGVTVDSDIAIAESDETNNHVVDSDPIYLYKGLPLSDCDSFGPLGLEYSTGINCRIAEVDGYARTYIVYVPDGALDIGTAPVPTVTMFHGGSGHGTRFLHISGWREKADEEGFITAFPTSAMYCETGRTCEDGRLSGWSTSWNHLTLVDAPNLDMEQKPPGYPESAPWPADDIQFVGAMFDDMQALLPVDKYRNYISGFSSGAQFARQLVFAMPERLAAAGIVAGGLDSNRDPDIPPSTVVPLYLAVGDRDEKVLSTFGLSSDETISLDPTHVTELMGDTLIDGTLETLGLAHDPNHLVPDQVHREPTTTRLSWNTPIQSDSRSEFHLSVWGDLAHVYPNEQSAGKNPNGHSAVDTFWSFFQMHYNRIPGDSNGDGIFNSADLIAVFAAGEYEDGIENNSTFEEGDWNGDGEFDSGDLVYVFQERTYVRSATRSSIRVHNRDPLFDLDELFGKQKRPWSQSGLRTFE